MRFPLICISSAFQVGYVLIGPHITWLASKVALETGMFYNSFGRFVLPLVLADIYKLKKNCQNMWFQMARFLPLGSVNMC